MVISARNPEDFPCSKEKSLSLKCLNGNNFDHSKCHNAFANFKACLAFWDLIKLTRRKNKITPELPPPDKRAEILNSYKRTGQIPDPFQD